MMKIAGYLLMVLMVAELSGTEQLMRELMDFNNLFIPEEYYLYDTAERFLHLPLANSFMLHPVDKLDGEGCTSLFNCAGCNTVLICQPTSNGTYLQLANTTCPQTTPYCVASTGTCSSRPDPHCGTPEPFICPSDGYFPDATNCSIYHVCNSYKSNSFMCGSSKYDADAEACDIHATCQTANCSDRSGRKVPLGSTHYYAYCLNGLPYLINRCPGDYKLNVTTQDCEAICSQAGLRPDYFDCTKYYRCTMVFITQGNSVMQRQHMSCPVGQAFDTSSYMCVSMPQTTCNVLKRP